MGHAATQAQLAGLHAQRALVVHRGWLPWRALVRRGGLQTARPVTICHILFPVSPCPNHAPPLEARLLPTAPADRPATRLPPTSAPCPQVQQARWRDECAAEHAQHALQASVLGRWGWRLRRRRAGLSCQLAVVAVWAQRLRRRHTMRGGLERLRAAAQRHEACVRAARRRLGAAALTRLLRGWAVTTEMSRERREAEEDRRGLAAAERVQLGVRARCWGGWVAFVEARRFEHEARSRTDELWSKVRHTGCNTAPHAAQS